MNRNNLRRDDLCGDDSGMSTVEYALGTLAAAAFAAVLMKILTGDAVADQVAGIIERALSTSF